VPDLPAKLRLPCSSAMDRRAMPVCGAGMSVNIIDLAGLKMSDAAGEAFRFIR